MSISKENANKSKTSSSIRGKEILTLVKVMSGQRGLDVEDVFEAVETALAAVAAKNYEEKTGEIAQMRVAVDRKTGEYETFLCRMVVSDDASEGQFEHEITLSDAKKIDQELEIGDVIEESIDGVPTGRIAAQRAKQFIMQEIREKERSKVMTQYQSRVDEMLFGVVKRVTPEGAILEIEGVDAWLAREEMLPRERLQMNDRVRILLYQVRQERRGPPLLVSRTRAQFLVELFKIEVPEIGDEVIEIMAAARDPGSRAKIAVKTNDGRIDPIGACVGMRGSRVQAVSNELGGERVDIILWDDNPAQLVINAMAPAEVTSIVVEESTHSMDIIVTPEQLSQAIGRNGQNVRLASELTGWTLNVMTEEEASQKHESETHVTKELFMKKLDVDEEVAEALVQEGFSSVEEVAYVPAEELSTIEGFDEDLSHELQRRASDVLLIQEIASEEKISEHQPAKDLLALDGMTNKLAYALAKNGIITRENLADLAVDDLVETVDIDEATAAKIIMAARAHWFEKEKE